jgi:hypothetical protein
VVLAVAVLGGSAAGVAQPGGLAKVDARLAAALERDGTADVWVAFRARADLRAASGLADWDERGKRVVEALRRTAARDQAAVRRLLRERGIPFTAFWVVNTLRLRGDRPLVAALAARPEVARLRADRSFSIPRAAGARLPARAAGRAAGIEWNVDRVRAPLVWSTFNKHGEGVVVGMYDSGARWTHDAIDDRYRGVAAPPDPSNIHDYNWFDGLGLSSVPIDEAGVGTAETGIAVGDDGGANQVGVAPAAQWIAARACQISSCTLGALLSAGQWFLAPTRVNGSGADAALRPHVVIGGWGGAGSDVAFQAMVQNWVAAGIFPVFMAGNSGPGSGSVSYPGSYPESYAAGAIGMNGLIATFSSRGPSPIGGAVKPDIAAPGVTIRSAYNTNDTAYNTLNSTGMAAAHVGGALALLWSVRPSLLRDIPATTAVLDGAAVNSPSATCGASAANDNNYGEGCLDAFAAANSGPTAVAVMSFIARKIAGGVRLRWRTASEVGLAGFRLYRETGATRVADGGVVAASGAARGHRYAVTLRGAAPAGTRYWLRVLERSGRGRWIGPAAGG